MQHRVTIFAAWALAGSAAGCAGRPLDSPGAGALPAPAVTASRVAPSKLGRLPAASATAKAEPIEPETDAGMAEAPAAPVRACPSGMQHVRFDYCPKLLRRCLDKEYDKPNHITICNRFATSKPECREPRLPLDFCIDEYEYPNRAGAKPPVMLNFFEAQTACAT